MPCHHTILNGMLINVHETPMKFSLGMHGNVIAQLPILGTCNYMLEECHHHDTPLARLPSLQFFVIMR